MGNEEKSSTPGVAEGTSPIGIPLDTSIAIEERISAWTKDFPVHFPFPFPPILLFHLIPFALTDPLSISQTQELG